MEIVFKAAAAALFSSAACLLIKRTNPELAMLLGICSSAVILCAAISASDGVKRLADTVRTMAGTSSRCIVPVLKCTAISVVTKIGASFCRDASQSAAAASLELVGALCALAAAMPLLLGMLTMIGELV